MPNQIVKDMERAAAPAAPSDEQLRRDLQIERDGRQRAENDLAQLQVAARNEWQGRTEAERRLAEMRGPQRPDPFATLSEEGVAVTPERHRELLDAGVRQRTREEVERSESERERRERIRDQQRDTQQALTIFAAMNPTIVADEEGFYGAMGKAQLRMQKSGFRLTPLQLLESGKGIYFEDRTRAGLPISGVPFTEGATMPAGPGGKEPKVDEKVQNMLEGYYGLEAGTLHPDGGEYSMDDHTRDWIDTRNLALNDTEKFSSSIRQVRGTLEEGKQRRRASAAGR